MSMYRTIHAETRAWQRYGCAPTAPEWRDAVCAITSTVMGLVAPAMRLRRHRGGIEEWIVRVGDVAMRVVYNPASACIVTVLPPHLRRQ